MPDLRNNVFCCNLKDATWVRAHAGPGGNAKIEIGAGGAPTLKNTCTNSRRRRRTTQRPSCEYSPRGSSQLHDSASLFLWCLQKRGGGGRGLPLDLCRRSARNALPECDQTGCKRGEWGEGEQWVTFATQALIEHSSLYFISLCSA